MSKKLILIVEDDQAIRMIFKLALERKGYDVFAACNGQEALDLLKNSPLPDLILLDLMMPVMDGWTFVEAIQAVPDYSDIPFIIVSAYENQVTHPKGEVLKRAAGSITKPPRMVDLINKVKESIG
ncbi:MAG: response regulator [Bdellovibrionia bacterium]